MLAFLSLCADYKTNPRQRKRVFIMLYERLTKTPCAKILTQGV